eukprot:2525562-Rhodomonas_salina.1
MVACSAGYQLRPGAGGWESGYGLACSSSFYARCVDGNLSFSVTSGEWMTEAPVCERHCGALEDACGE